MKVCNYLPLSFEPKIDSLLHTEEQILDSKSTLSLQKNSTPFRQRIPDFRQNNRKSGGNIGYFERTFIHYFKNIGEKNTSFGCS